ncbi:MAG TPA: glutamine-hydrolyzing GMP synthase [Saprospiraceae bacterium]|nr:glutamine-hydrolyzing GMP synthase [Saprospiraceae bacterium]MCB9328481.1 glutamine-hydrolyzing GMP synthase [Lewinellaceae bacterium]HPK09592.1 glutamine-hydrolyzing GMP synthase [Saprospiraceae bacterium]HPQ20437.1 glutamine-hydrolyzing GMP synthase [Saprospiraceae bacterium]
MNDKIIILDFGSQYTQLIARRLRELGYFCEIKPFNISVDEILTYNALVLSGSPFSVLDDNALHFDIRSVIGKLPILAICYGAQYIANEFSGEVIKSDKREYGKAALITERDIIFDDLESNQVWMSHGDSITNIPQGYEIIASTEQIPVAAFKTSSDNSVYCFQFHPEVTHSLSGTAMLHNWVSKIAKLNATWTPEYYIHETVANLQETIQNDKVVLGLSGGVDSSVAAMLLNQAIGQNLYCIFIDNGLLRLNEFEEVLASYQSLGLNIKGVDASQEFLDALKGVSDPEKKRKIIGKVFIDVFERESKKLDNVKWLAQGTIYPDVIESVSVHGPSVTIKSHHNVGGLPEKLHLKIVEPLRMLFKDEVRKVGRELGLPEHLISRHPFPGPGLAIRLLGDIDEDKLNLLKRADHIFIKNLRNSGYYDRVWQAGAILLPIKSVGVMGDERTYEFTVALRCVNSVDGMTAEWSELPHDLLAKISNEIINTVKGINRVVYDISTKPPATIEWE